MKIYLLLSILFIVSCSKKIEPDSPRDDWSAKVQENIDYGKDLILNTSMYFGPNGSISQTSNGMNCTNCHLDAGTRDFGNNYKAVFANYPKFRERSGMKESLEKRINDCFQRSLNGNVLPENSAEIKAMMAYINSVGKNVPKNTTPEGSGITKLKLLTRAANPDFGKLVYDAKCTQCHGQSGEGSVSGNKSGSYFIYPPLWGKNSFNTSAGLSRIKNLSGFIYDNMPYNSATHQSPVLSEEEAWDVAAYIISKSRPEKFFKEDWPNLKTKPIDYAYAPYADSFSEKQHKFGPYQAILDFRKKND